MSASGTREGGNCPPGSGGGGCLRHPPGQTHPLDTHSPTHTHTLVEVAIEADGTHPTGMHSCFINLFVVLVFYALFRIWRLYLHFLKFEPVSGVLFHLWIKIYDFVKISKKTT